MREITLICSRVRMAMSGDFYSYDANATESTNPDDCRYRIIRHNAATGENSGPYYMAHEAFLPVGFDKLEPLTEYRSQVFKTAMAAAKEAQREALESVFPELAGVATRELWQEGPAGLDHADHLVTLTVPDLPRLDPAMIAR